MRYHRMIPAAVLALAGSTAAAQVLDWNNAAGGNWNDVLNWTPMGIPDALGESSRISLAGIYTVTMDTSPTIDELHLLNPDATLTIPPGRILALAGPTSTNNGLIQLNPNGSSSNSTLSFSASTALGGNGQIRMRTASDNSQIVTGGGATLTNGASHTIRGVGQLKAVLVNDGVVAADVGVSVSGNTLDLIINGKTNNNLLVAEAGSILNINAITITQGPGGTIRANAGGDARLNAGTNIIGGSLDGLGTGVVQTFGAVGLRDVMNLGTLFDNSGSTIGVTGAGLTNDGVIEMNRQGSSSNAVLRFDASGTLGGTGEIQMRTLSDNTQITTALDQTITHAATHLIRGVGWITASMVNDGEIRADVSVSVAGNELDLFGSDKINNTLMAADDGSILDIAGITIDQTGGGQLLAMDGATGGTVRIGTSTILGGTIDAVGTGLLTTDGNSTFTSVILNTPTHLNAANTLAINGTGLTNNGVMEMNRQGSSSNAVLDFAQTGTLGGTGEVQLRTGGGNSLITTGAGATITHAATHSIRGAGDVHADMVNNGPIFADVSISVSGNQMRLLTNGKVNNSVMGARAGSILEIGAITIDDTNGSLLADEGTIELATGARVVGGTIDGNGAGTLTTVGNPSLSGVTLNLPSFLNAANTITIDAGGLTNNGLMQLNIQGSSANAVLDFAQTGTLGGTGEVQLRTGGDDSQVTTAVGMTATIGPAQTISGNGQINGSVVLDGTLRPGLSVGSIATSGSLAFGATSVYDIEIGGTATSQFDRITGTSDITIDPGAHVRAELVGGFSPLCDEFVIITGASITGRFDEDVERVGTFPNGLTYRFFYTPTQVILKTNCLADLNGDCTVDVGDFFEFVALFAAGDQRADLADDDVINVLDFFAFVSAFASGCA